MDTAVAEGLVGLFDGVKRDTVTPDDTSGVALTLIAQIRNEYWVPPVSPVTECDVPEIEVSEMVVPLAQSAGAVDPTR